jgi:uncharacterized protein (TIGR02594 family)
MIISEALRHYGVSEANDMPQIMDWTRQFMQRAIERVNWCGVFVGVVASSCGLHRPEMPFRALAWREVGTIVPLEFAVPGDVAIIRRRGGYHVAFFVRSANGLVWLLGGNQSRSVCTKAYSLGDLVCIRRIDSAF